jgi:hypothetical protein
MIFADNGSFEMDACEDCIGGGINDDGKRLEFFQHSKHLVSDIVDELRDIY